MQTHHRVRLRRESLGLTQAALAAAAQLTRQSVGAIEAGRAMPAVDVALRLARALGCQVEDLFGEAPPDPALPVELAGPPSASGRVSLTHVRGRWVAHTLDGAHIAADALMEAAIGRQPGGVPIARPLRPEAELRENVALVGCAAALGLLADRLNSGRGPGRFLWLSKSSTAALQDLALGRALVAGMHLVDARSGEANVSDVRRLCGDQPLVLVTLARWEAGLVLPPGNPLHIRTVDDLARPGLRLVTREVGSGARALLERELLRHGMPVVLAASGLCAAGHAEVARAVQMGAVDVGIATRDAALTHGLDFLPLAWERYDLAFPREAVVDTPDPRLTRLLDGLAQAGFRREIAALGYDTGPCGDRVSEASAA